MVPPVTTPPVPAEPPVPTVPPVTTTPPLAVVPPEPSTPPLAVVPPEPTAPPFAVVPPRTTVPPTPDVLLAPASPPPALTPPVLMAPPLDLDPPRLMVPPTVVTTLVPATAPVPEVPPVERVPPAAPPLLGRPPLPPVPPWEHPPQSHPGSAHPHRPGMNHRCPIHRRRVRTSRRCPRRRPPPSSRRCGLSPCFRLLTRWIVRWRRWSRRIRRACRRWPRRREYRRRRSQTHAWPMRPRCRNAPDSSGGSFHNQPPQTKLRRQEHRWHAWPEPTTKTTGSGGSLSPDAGASTVLATCTGTPEYCVIYQNKMACQTVGCYWSDSLGIQICEGVGDPGRGHRDSRWRFRDQRHRRGTDRDLARTGGHLVHHEVGQRRRTQGLPRHNHQPGRHPRSRWSRGGGVAGSGQHRTHRRRLPRIRSGNRVSRIQHELCRSFGEGTTEDRPTPPTVE